jgi:ATP-dependent DNA helicase PIF1
MRSAAAHRLNAEQAAALEAVKHGRNIFLTGAGGTGKSHTIRAITDWATAAGIHYALTALTGCAALLLGTGAKTLHSWAGIGLARDTPHVLAEAVRRNKRAQRRWLDTQLLIVDEVSMMSPDLLEKLDAVARRVRRRAETPFGGLQVLFAGDFCQLPPVVRGVSGETTVPRFCFELPLWRELITDTIYLRQIQRQRDPTFQSLLSDARMGALSAESVGILESRMGLPWQDAEIRPTLLFARNAEVDRVNQRNMEALTGDRRVYDAQTVLMEKTGRRPGAPATLPVTPDDPDVAAALERLDSDAPYDPTLTLIVGAQVMLLVNMDPARGLVNGSRGVLHGYTAGGLPVVRFLSCGEPVVVDRAAWWLSDYDGIGRSQIPLRIAYAITVHRAQGATLDSALIDIGSSTFEYGQAYVALSRVRSLEGLYVWKLDPRKVACHPTVADFYEALRPTEPTDPTLADPAPDTDPNDPAAPAIPTATLPAPWRAIVEAHFATPAGARLLTAYSARAAAAPVAPAPDEIFAALHACPDPAAIRVIILGQDPYPTPGHAHGLAFSVRPAVTRLPPTLKNIFKELTSDLAATTTAEPPDGCLAHWAAQGVLLLNTTLTVTCGAPLSHAGIGWEDLTAQLLTAVLRAAPHVAILAWGRHAQDRLRGLPMERHTIIAAPHPSPLSAHTGFYGSRPFSRANEALTAHGQTPIRWLR